jgi:hypothetical protein
MEVGSNTVIALYIHAKQDKSKKTSKTYVKHKYFNVPTKQTPSKIGTIYMPVI